MTGMEHEHGRDLNRGAVAARTGGRQAPRRPAEARPVAAGDVVELRLVGAPDPQLLAAVDLAVTWGARSPRGVVPDLAELIGVGSAFDGAEWHFYAVNAEPAAGQDRGTVGTQGPDGGRADVGRRAEGGA